MALTLITFVGGTNIKSSEVNSNFSAINTELFDISNDNIAAAAGIVDTKLATISTAGKVNGSAIVSETIDAVKGWFCWGLSGEISTGTNVSFEWEATSNLLLIGVVMNIKTAPTDADLIIDINKNGTSVFTTRPQINDGTQVQAGTEVFDTGAGADDLVSGDLLTLDVDQVGSTVAGSDLSIQLLAEQKVPQ